MKIKLLFLFAICCNSLFGEWITRQPMPTQRQEMPAVLVNRKIYVIGGITTNLLEGFVTKKNESYDINTNSWKALKDMPGGRHHPAVAAVQNKIYVIGGYDNVDFNPVSTVFVYDIQNDNWSQAAHLPFKAGAGDAVTYNNKIYYFGGANNQHTLDSSMVYDPADDSWTVLAPMPTAREHIAATLIDSLIYITAGRGSTDADKLLQIYHPQTNTWSNGADLPTPRSGSDAVTHDHKMYVLGGEGGRAFDEFEEYDPATNSWDSLPKIPHARHGLGCIVVNDTLYAIGGATMPGFAPCAFNEAYVFASIPTGIVTKEVNAMKVYWPDDNHLSIKIPENAKRGMLLIYNEEGKLFYRKQVSTDEPVEINRSSWSAGYYLITMSVDEKVYMAKIMTGFK